MTCSLCFSILAEYELECKCGWKRVVTAAGRSSYITETKGGSRGWFNIPQGCLLALGDGPGSSEEGPDEVQVIDGLNKGCKRL